MNAKKKSAKPKQGRPRIENPEPVVTLSIRLPVELNEKISVIAKKNHRARSNEIIACLENVYMNSN